MSRVLTVTANYLNKVPPKGYEFDRPQPYIRGKFFYIWINDHIVKHRFLGYCVDQYAFRIATRKEDIWGSTPVPTYKKG